MTPQPIWTIEAINKELAPARLLSMKANRRSVRLNVLVGGFELLVRGVTVDAAVRQAIRATKGPEAARTAVP